MSSNILKIISKEDFEYNARGMLFSFDFIIIACTVEKFRKHNKGLKNRKI